jgi:hypothetical protein
MKSTPGRDSCCSGHDRPALESCPDGKGEIRFRERAVGGAPSADRAAMIN